MAESYFNCPHCNQQISVTAQRQSVTWPGHTVPQPGHTFASTSPWSPPSMGHTAPPGEWQRKTPYRPPSVAHDVLPALAAAGVSGAFALAGSLTASALSTWPWWAAVPCSLGIAVVTWYGASQRAAATLYQTEWFVTSQVDVPVAGSQAAPPMGVKVQVSNGQGHWQFENLPGEAAALQQLAVAVLGGDNFAERTATTAGLTQEQFGKLRDIFVARGWAEWRHPNRKQQGVELLRNGRAILRAIAAAPLPDDETP